MLPAALCPSAASFTSHPRSRLRGIPSSDPHRGAYYIYLLQCKSPGVNKSWRTSCQLTNELPAHLIRPSFHRSVASRLLLFPGSAYYLFFFPSPFSLFRFLAADSSARP
ncbi:hypothetical protein LX36DRAFT_123292 [Colletotrichum falcatum]|nr:hypothetical protein LX36DRAFT_123292 [Colletotrichum falcatum]